MNTLKPDSPAMEAYQKVRKAIVNQTLKPGKALTESYLCESLNMGRSPVRAALMQLSLDGFVEMPPNRSARVARFSQTQVRQIYSMRHMILFHALELTIDAYTEKDIQYLDSCLERQTEAFRNSDFESYLNAIYDFFYFITHKANNPYLDEISDSILKRTNVFLFLYDNFYSVEKLKSLPLLEKMLRGIQQKKVKSIMKAHNELVSRTLDAYDRMVLMNSD